MLDPPMYVIVSVVGDCWPDQVVGPFTDFEVATEWLLKREGVKRTSFPDTFEVPYDVMGNPFTAKAYIREIWPKDSA